MEQAMTATKTVTNTKLLVATAVMLVAGGLAFAVAPFSYSREGANCIDSVTLEKQCGKTGYNSASFTCSDGTKIVQSEKKCLTAKQWDSYSAQLCKSHCKATGVTKKNLDPSSGQVRELCSDNQDNDGDQLVDCADNECNSDTNCAAVSRTGTGEIPSTAVIFADINLENAVRETINKPNGYVLKSDVNSIAELRLNGKGILNLQGLEEFRSLVLLDLRDNQISDIAPITSLTGLMNLNIDNNRITSLGQFRHLIALQELSLRQNQITSMDIQGSISGLKRLYLSNNQINDMSGLITPLSLFAFPMLEEIYLDNNQISSLSAFSGVQTIKKLNLANNPISDISPLDSSLQITFIDLTNNPIHSLERMRYWNSLQRVLVGGTALDGPEDCTMIGNLRARGVTVIVDSRISNTLCEI
ncbi:MAG: leucine-rich repeat domain-containing protein [Candidatus Magasanikbacteria bacterium]